MGIISLKKGVWLLLFFSLALNIGFVFTATTRKMRPESHPLPGPERPALKVLDRMDLAEGVRQKATDSLKQMEADHRKFVKLLFKEEEKLTMLIARPGSIDMGMVSPLIESFSQISKKSALNKAEYIIKIRNLLGSKKSLYLISEIKKDFKKRKPKDRHQN